MASESTEDRTVSVSLPTELHEWVQEQTATGDIDEETLVVQLLSAYRETEEFDGDLEEGVLGVSDSAIAETVDTKLDETREAIQQRVESHVDGLETEYGERFDELEELLADVRDDLDQVAGPDHSHEEFSRIESLESDVEKISQEIEEFEKRIETLAWVVSDLREAQESEEIFGVVDRIKRIAAAADMENANCQECGESVILSLLVEPECPHCGTSVRDVEPADGWFGSPQLISGTPQGVSGDESEANSPELDEDEESTDDPDGEDE